MAKGRAAGKKWLNGHFIVRASLIAVACISCGIFGYTLAVTYGDVRPSSTTSHLRPPKPNNKNSVKQTTRLLDDESRLSKQQPSSAALSLETRQLGTKIWSKTPSNWEEMTFSELRDYYACSEHAHDQDKALPTLDEWMFLKKQVRELVHPINAIILDSPVEPTHGFSHGVDDYADMPPPYYAGQSDGKGRGLFASRPIKKGELVHDGPRSNIMFPDSMSFRRLVVNLPRRTACDITEWAWTQRLEKDGEARLFVDLNIAALMNTSHDPNIAPKSKTTTQLYALRDIKQGEEIMYDYGTYPWILPDGL